MSVLDNALKRGVHVAYVVALLGLPACAPTTQRFDPMLVTTAPAGPDSASTEAWAAKADSQISGNAFAVLDESVYCFVTTCQRFVRRVQPSFEMNYRNQVTRSVSGEVGATVVASGLRQYLVPSQEYATFRMLALLVDTRPEAVLVESERIVLDRQRAIVDSQPLLYRALEGPALVAAVLLERHGRLEANGPLRLTLDSAKAHGTADDWGKLLDPSRELAIVFGEFLPSLVSQHADIQVPMEGVVRSVRLAVPALPAHRDTVSGCTLRTGGGTERLILVGDFDASAHAELAQAASGAAQRSLIRGVGRQMASDEASKRVTAGASLGTALITKSLMSGLFARTERADTRGSALVPSRIYLASVTASPSGAELACTSEAGPMAMRLREVAGGGMREERVWFVPPARAGAPSSSQE